MGSTKVIELRCEYLQDPLGLTVRRPRLGWKLRADRKNVLQKAYRIQVSADDGTFAEPDLVWDSGRVDSDESVHVPYAGRGLESVTRYLYRVRVWDEQGEESPWSETACWETGLLDSREWRAQWITPSAEKTDPAAKTAFYLRGEFETTGQKVSRATILATALGLYELELDGSRVGDSLFTPGWTSYDHRLQVQAYDVTEQLKGASGKHVLGAVLADGWYKGRLGWEGRRDIYGDRRALLLQLHIRYEDGTQQIVASDESWRTNADGPIRMSGLYEGETYDASFERPGWSAAGFDDSAWHPAERLERSKNTLIGEQSERVKVTEMIAPVSLIVTPAGETVLDLGQNMVGRMAFSVQAPAGTVLTLHHAEVLDREGNFYTGNLRTAQQEVTYICRGGGEEGYRPSFTFQGFRYVRLTGFPDPVDLHDFAGEVIHTEMHPTGSFECSNPLINRLQRNIVWGQRGNFLDIPTDCPQRDERLGWTGDAQVFIRTAAFNYGVAPFFTKWLKDLAAEQLSSGGVPFVVPNILGEGSHSSAAWGDAAVICPWTIYLCYGDLRILDEQYDSMAGWVEYIRAQGDDELLWNTGFHFGDWLALDAKENSYIGATPRDLICTAFFAYSTSLVAKAAAVLGKKEDARKYGELHDRIVRAFADEFLTPNGRLAGHTQTAHVLALMFDLVEGAAKQRLADTLAEYVREQQMHLTTGFVGTPYLCRVLSDNGHHDVAVQLVLQEEYPSWLYSVNQGATTIWEHWDGIKPDGSFWSDDMNSYNHYAYGAVGDWLYRSVAGLDTDESAPGCKRINLRPNPESGLTHARAQYDSPYGIIVSGWNKQEDGSIAYEFELPPNTTAEVRLPYSSGQAVRIDELEASEAMGPEAVRTEEDSMVLELGSGRYAVRVGV